jgi:formate hydrogenlyase subunit 6/NADH:ubiquinone oxidoreductase subunit I
MISSKKCTGCHMCELACSAWHDGAYRPSVARLSSTVNPTTTAVKGQTCLQTACAKCEEACPEGAFSEGPSAGKAIGDEGFRDALQEYYRLRGWDENGVPTEAKLAEVGLDVRL